MTKEDWDEMEANDYASRPMSAREQVAIWLVLIVGTGLSCLLLAMLAAWVLQ